MGICERNSGMLTDTGVTTKGSHMLSFDMNSGDLNTEFQSLGASMFIGMSQIPSPTLLSYGIIWIIISHIFKSR